MPNTIIKVMIVKVSNREMIVSELVVPNHSVSWMCISVTQTILFIRSVVSTTFPLVEIRVDIILDVWEFSFILKRVVCHRKVVMVRNNVTMTKVTMTPP
jgi:hypothetical protein